MDTITHENGGVTMADTATTTQGIQTVLHPVTDLAKSKAVYAALLGTAPQADSEYYVGFQAEGQQIGLVPGGGPQGMTAPVAYWHVADIEAKLAEVTAAGAAVRSRRTTSAAAASSPRSPTRTATSSGCCRIDERDGREAHRRRGAHAAPRRQP